MIYRISLLAVVLAAAACTSRYDAASWLEQNAYTPTQNTTDVVPAPAPQAQHPGAARQQMDNKTAPPDEQAAYTCPMHPEVRRLGPGKCPKCGMHLQKSDPAEPDKKGGGGSDQISQRTEDLFQADISRAVITRGLRE